MGGRRAQRALPRACARSYLVCSRCYGALGAYWTDCRLLMGVLGGLEAYLQLVEVNFFLLEVNLSASPCTAGRVEVDREIFQNASALVEVDLQGFKYALVGAEVDLRCF